MTNFARILCIDYGNKRIGVAVSDFTLTIASPLVTIPSHSPFESLLKIISEYNIFKIIIGKPISLSGENGGKQLKEVQKFANKLSTVIDIPIEFWDERLSTHAAMRYISDAKISIAKQKRIKDKIAASYILNSYLDHMNFKR